MNTLIELAHLQWTRPSGDAAPTVVAAWYASKAAVHEHLAVECPDRSSRARELAYAEQARRHARSLLATPAPTSMNGAKA